MSLPRKVFFSARHLVDETVWASHFERDGKGEGLSIVEWTAACGRKDLQIVGSYWMVSLS